MNRQVKIHLIICAMSLFVFLVSIWIPNHLIPVQGVGLGAFDFGTGLFVDFGIMVLSAITAIVSGLRAIWLWKK